MTEQCSTHAEEARAISQRFLDLTGAAFLAHDFQSYAENFIIPCRIHCFEADRIIDNPADLHALFSRVHTYFTSIGVTSLERDCVSAEFSASDTIQSTHITRLMRDSQLLESPFPVLAVLRHDGCRWKIASSQYATEDKKLTKALIIPPPERPGCQCPTHRAQPLALKPDNTTVSFK